MLREAIKDIQRSDESSKVRHHQLAASRVQMRRLDHWLGQVEAMLEQDHKTVPEPLVSEIAEFVQDIDPKLRRDLARNRGRSATRVLDVLFDAQEVLMPRTVTRRLRLASLYFRATWNPWARVARTFEPESRRERFLAGSGYWVAAPAFGTPQADYLEDPVDPSSWRDPSQFPGIRFLARRRFPAPSPPGPQRSSSGSTGRLPRG